MNFIFSNQPQVGQTKFHKSHHFTVIDNEVPYLTDRILPGIGGVPLSHSKADERPSLYAKGEVLDVPTWLVYDKQVLSFDAYYLETLLESGMYCNYMVRNCKILYFLEDGTMQVVEKAVNNSGLPQGIIIKRQKIRIPAGMSCSDFYGMLDLNVGKEIELFGKVLKITNCDIFTRKFLNRLGIPVPEGSTTPEDPYLEKRITDAQKRKGKVLKNKTVRKLMEMDNRILTFEGYWDDQETEGGYVHILKILYFLGDDTIEIKDVTDREKPHFILKRTKIAKEDKMSIEQPGENERVSLLNVLGPTVEKSRFVVDPLNLGVEEKEYYTERDITIGSIISSYGRRFVITNMDKFTKEYYTKKYGLEDLNPLEIPKSKDDEGIIEIKEAANEVPPYNGFGSYEDSLTNCLFLNPSTYVKSWKRVISKEPLGYDSKILRFLCELITDRQRPCNSRECVISYYLEDDTVSVFEIPKDNSGITGGYLIKKRKILRPSQNKFSNKPPEIMNSGDFFLGNILNLDNFIFYLKDIDEYSMKYMEHHPNEFPKNNLRLIIDKLREGIRKNYKKWAAQFLHQSDLKTLPYHEFRTYLIRELGNKITEHEILALARHYKLPLSKQSISLENLRCLVHDELKRLLYDDFKRLEENFCHFDKEKNGFVSLKDAYIALRGGKLPLSAEFISILIDTLAKAQSSEGEKISYRQLLDFLNYRKDPMAPMQRIRLSQMYGLEKLASAQMDPKVNYIDIKNLLHVLKLEEGLKNEGM